ncbi:MAG: ATP-grasp domain-containing protein [Roseburia sp.]|nr:ATP-grasp domain-containing protein [Roseburia sp.]
MKGLLIYDSIGAKRNEWFIESLISNFKKNNIELRLAIVKNDEIKSIEKTDFAIVRTISPNINKLLENLGVRVFNNYKTSFVANSKWETYLMCEKLKIPTMDTLYCFDTIDLQNFPYVIKSCSGHGGTEVFWVDSLERFIQIKTYFQSLNKDFIIQKPCSDLGKDMRIYIMGNEIVASILRYNEKDFKSNYSLGGKVKKVNPTNYQLDIIKKIVSHLNSDYIGIDFIFDNGIWVLNEIEDVVGARMLYKTTNIDIANKYVNYIYRKLL